MPPASPMLSAFLSIAMMAVLVLIWGAWWMGFRRKDPKKGVLMLVAALVLAGNIAIWTV